MELLAGTPTIEDSGAFLDRLRERADTDGVVQAFDARYIVDRTHLERAYTFASRADDRGHRIADSLAMEVLLYAAGRRQIEDALEIGVTPGEPVVVFLEDASNARTLTASMALERVATSESAAKILTSFDVSLVCSFYEISSRERKATPSPIETLVHERVALLVLER